MVIILNCYLYVKKSYGTLSKGAFFFWLTLYIYGQVFCCKKTVFKKQHVMFKKHVFFSICVFSPDAIQSIDLR